MNNMMTEFLSSASERAAVVLAEQGIARSAENLRKAEQEANRQALEGMIDRELKPLLAVLENLPEKDGKRFSIRIFDSLHPHSTTAQYGIYVSYQRQQSGRAHSSSHRENPWQPTVEMNLALDKGKVAGIVVQHSIADKEGKERSVKTSSFDEIRRELGLGIGNFAAERVEEIQRAAVSDQPVEQVKQKPTNRWFSPRFFL